MISILSIEYLETGVFAVPDKNLIYIFIVYVRNKDKVNNNKSKSYNKAQCHKQSIIKSLTIIQSITMIKSITQPVYSAQELISNPLSNKKNTFFSIKVNNNH